MLTATHLGKSAATMCPTGMIWDADFNQCIPITRWDTTPADQNLHPGAVDPTVCAPGTRLINAGTPNAQCMQDQAAVITCPAGFFVSGNKCVMNPVPNPADITDDNACPTGMIPTAAGCVPAGTASESITRKWYFWAGIAVAAGAFFYFR